MSKTLDSLIHEALDNIRGDRKLAREFLNEIANQIAGDPAQNKYLSVEYTKKMIEKDNDHFQQLFDQSKKKDDLADSYLQGIYWIEK